MAYSGPERRADNIDLEKRVRDLEEENRASIKSRQAMHKQLGDLNTKMDLQLGDLNTKMDLMLSRQDEKNDACAVHRTETALLKQSQEVNDKAIEAHKAATKDAIDAVEEEQIWLRRTAIGGLAVSVISLIGALWAVVTGK